MNQKFKAWRKELVAAGQIVQDDDESRTEEERVALFERYLELADGVTGAEKQDVFQAVLDSIHPVEDHGAYEATYRALWRFPTAQAAAWMAEAFPALYRRLKLKSFQLQRMICPVLQAGEAQDAFLLAAGRWNAAHRRTALAAFRHWAIEDPDFERMLVLLGGRIKKTDPPEDAPLDWPDDWRSFLTKVRSGKKRLVDAWGDGSKPASRLDLVIALLGMGHGTDWREISTLTTPLFVSYAMRCYPAFIAKLRTLPESERNKALAAIRRASPDRWKVVTTSLAEAGE